jgi:hypothetical protein
MTDHVWAVRVGTLPSLKASIKKLHTKKMAKLGFFVELEELNEQENKRLLRAYNQGEDFIFNGLPVNRQLIRSAFNDAYYPQTAKQFFVAKFMGPKLLNGVPRAN